MCWDVATKISYYKYSRFVSIELKQIYLSFLFFRPMLILLMTVYNVLLGYKENLNKRERDSKKFKDDITYQKE